MPAESPMPAPLLLDAAGVCAALSIGKSHYHEMKSTGRFPLTPIRLGRAVRFSAAELSAWIDAGCPADDRWRALQAARKGAA